MNSTFPRFYNPATQASRRLNETLAEIASGVRELRESAPPAAASENQPTKVESPAESARPEVESRPPPEPFVTSASPELTTKAVENLPQASNPSLEKQESSNRRNVDGEAPPPATQADGSAARTLRQRTEMKSRMDVNERGEEQGSNRHLTSVLSPIEAERMPTVPDLRPELAAFVTTLNAQHEATRRSFQQVVDLCAKQQREMQRLGSEIAQLSSRLNMQIQRA